jgi:alkanesulfonate monooxygenase SsuD/methylene tetrahydromethanopterin reductase-like flavin-dependent oxidoreductase (luciferase family)
MKFGVWYDFRNPPEWHVPYDRLYRENLEQIALAERLGYESVWVSEHHVTSDGYLPSVFPLLAAIAMRTSRVRIGSAIILGPFQHPVRFAEDVAFVDQLSGGRLEVGLGLGYRPREFELLGVPREQRASLTEALVTTARSVWADGTVTPPPLQQPEPPFWIGGSSPAAARRAARLGCSFMPDAFVATDVIELYRSLGGIRISINPSVYVGDWDDVAPHFLYQYNLYREWGGGQKLSSADELPRDRYLIGSPETVAAGVRALVERTGAERLFFWGRPPGLPIELANRSVERFAREVMPLVAVEEAAAGA